jgi:hypothetical protein
VPLEGNFPVFTLGAPPYVGPGDVQSGAQCWGGLRAYSAATAGTRFVNLRASGNNATSDFNTLTSGLPDTASIQNFLTANGGSLFVTALYDQSGNGLDWTQATTGAQPAFTLNGLGTLPIMSGNGAFLSQAGTFALGNPWSLVSASLTTDTTTVDMIAWDNSIGNGFGFSTGTSCNLFIAGAGSASGTVTTNTWYALIGSDRGGNVQEVYANGVLGGGGGTATSSGWSGSSLNYMTRTSGVQVLNGSSVELGLFPVSDLTPGFIANMTVNIRNFWGF